MSPACGKTKHEGAAGVMLLVALCLVACHPEHRASYGTLQPPAISPADRPAVPRGSVALESKGQGLPGGTFQLDVGTLEMLGAVQSGRRALAVS